MFLIGELNPKYLSGQLEVAISHVSILVPFHWERCSGALPQFRMPVSRLRALQGRLCRVRLFSTGAVITENNLQVRAWDISTNLCGR